MGAQFSLFFLGHLKFWLPFWSHFGTLFVGFINIKEINKIAITKIALLAIIKIDQKSNAASGITGVSLGLTWGALGAHLGLTPSHWGLTGVSLGSPWPSGVSLGTLKASRGFRRGLRRRVLKMLCFYTLPARLN